MLAPPDKLIERLQTRGALESPRIIDAFRAVPRKQFVPDNQQDNAYQDTALPIGEGQTISAPHMVAHMTELLDPQSEDQILEIGAGSGYQAAILAELVEQVTTVEIVDELAEQAQNRLADRDTVTVIHGDGSTGYKPEAPYNKILYTAAAPEIPGQVFDQLDNGGKLVAPVGGTHQNLNVYMKDSDGSITTETHYGVRFVPLTGEKGNG
jgi:protein-L-isoaspartate(D-aspartate) O-methyltransferase